MIGVILAAGSGTRLKPLTESRSKAMMPIAGTPIVERVARDFERSGVQDILIVVNPRDLDIARHFANKTDWNSNVRLIEQSTPEGTAHAIECVSSLIDDDFIVAACDNLMDEGVIDQIVGFWQERSLSALLSVMRISGDDVFRTGIVEIEGKNVISIIEKPLPGQTMSNVASLPLYIFSPVALQYMRDVQFSIRGERELQSAIQQIINDGLEVNAFHVIGRRDLTSVADFLAMNRYYLDLEGPFEIPTNLKTSNEFVQPVRIEPGVSIGNDCVVGPNVYLEKGAIIGDEAVIRNSVILRDSMILDGSVLINEVTDSGRLTM